MGKMTDREKHIKNLSCIMDSMPDDACGDWRDSLAYAISSLKTDEAYQIMYEGGEIFTKDDVVAMMTELQLEIEELDLKDSVPDYQKGADETREYIADLLQQKIDAFDN